MQKIRVMLLVLFMWVSSAANVCGQNKTIGLSVVSSLSLSYPGLEAVAAAVAAGDLDGACEALSVYYQNSNTSSWLRVPPVTPGTGRVGPD